MVSIRVNIRQDISVVSLCSFKSRIVQHQIKTIDTSGVMHNLKKSDFDKVLIPRLPPLPEQKAYARSLTCISDDKIEL